MDDDTHKNAQRIKKYEMLKHYESLRKSIGITFLLSLFGGMFGLSVFYLEKKRTAVIIGVSCLIIMLLSLLFMSWTITILVFLFLFFHFNVAMAVSAHLTVDDFNNSLKSDLEKKYELI